MHLGDQRGVPQCVVQHQHRAVQVFGNLQVGIARAVGKLVYQQAARDMRCHFPCAFERFCFERGEQRLHHILGPDAVHQLTAGAAGFQLLAGRGLDLHIQVQLVGQAPAGQGFQRGQVFTREGAGVPAASVELGDFTHAELAAHAVAVGGALQRGVMHQEQHAIFAELGIAFKEAIAVLRAQAEGAHGVFRCQLASSTMGDPSGIGPICQGGHSTGSPNFSRLPCGSITYSSRMPHSRAWGGDRGKPFWVNSVCSARVSART